MLRKEVFPFFHPIVEVYVRGDDTSDHRCAHSSRPWAHSGSI